MFTWEVFAQKQAFTASDEKDHHLNTIHQLPATDFRLSVLVILAISREPRPQTLIAADEERLGR